MERSYSEAMENVGAGARQAVSGLAALPGGLLGMLYQVWLAGIGIVARTATEAPRIIGSLAEDGARAQRATFDLVESAAGAVGRTASETARQVRRTRVPAPAGRTRARTKSAAKRAVRAKSNGRTRGARKARPRS